MRRYRVAKQILAAFCEAEGITPEELRARDLRPKAVDRRKRYAALCYSQKVGCVIIGKMLWRDTTAVEAYLFPEIGQKRLLRERAARLAARAQAVENRVGA